MSIFDKYSRKTKTAAHQPLPYFPSPSHTSPIPADHWSESKFQIEDIDPESDICELVFVVDRSGSMLGLEDDTIGGLNAVLEENKKQEGQVNVSIVLFDHETKVICDRKPIQQVKPLTRNDYHVRGATALLDAVGGAIKHNQMVQRYQPKGYKAGKVIMIITTDGMENASTKFGYSAIKHMIEKQKEAGWEFLFLGANIDAGEEAQRIGIDQDRMANYIPDSQGVEAMYDAVANATCAMRCAPSASIDGSWASKVNADFNRRSHI